MTRIQVHPDEMLKNAELISKSKHQLGRILYELEKTMHFLQSDWSGMTRENFFRDFREVKEYIFPSFLGLLDIFQGKLTDTANAFTSVDSSTGEVRLIPSVEPSFLTGLIDKAIGDTVIGLSDTVVSFFNNPLSTLGDVGYDLTIGKIVDVGRGFAFAWDTAWGTGTARSDIEEFVNEQKKQLEEDDSGYYKGAVIGKAASYFLFGKALKSKDHSGSGGSNGSNGSGDGKKEPEKGSGKEGTSKDSLNFVFNEKIALTEGQQKRIYNFLGKNAGDIIDLGLADENTLKKIINNLKEGKKPGKEGFALEANTAKLILENNIKISDAGKEINVKEMGGRIGEIDLATPDHIIECYNSVGGKSKSISDFDKYFEGDPKQPFINPEKKKVVLYAPNGIDPVKASNILTLDVKIITTPEELIKVLAGGY